MSSKLNFFNTLTHTTISIFSIIACNFILCSSSQDQDSRQSLEFHLRELFSKANHTTTRIVFTSVMNLSSEWLSSSSSSERQQLGKISTPIGLRFRKNQQARPTLSTGLNLYSLQTSKDHPRQRRILSHAFSDKTTLFFLVARLRLPGGLVGSWRTVDFPVPCG